jgi:hypothetical protein
MSRYSPVGDARPSEANPTRCELEGIQRSLEDRPPGEDSPPRPGGVLAPLAWVAAGLVGLMAFVGWLLVGPPLHN